ncbi:MAG: metallophosphoesterase family protein [Planctomycetota bacterium]|nr:metallophosphoesterase family protein [Planctomycetota bacterium]
MNSTNNSSCNELRPESHVSRRAFLKHGSLVLAGVGGAATLGNVMAGEDAAPSKPALRVGMLTDVHYSDCATRGTRRYRESLKKMAEAAEKFRASGVTSVIELGDFIDTGADLKKEIANLKLIEAEFVACAKDRHHVLGNHCVSNLTKEEFLGTVGAKAAHYSFDRGGFHFVVLDACYRSDGVAYSRHNFDWKDTNISPPELEWLEADLAQTKKRTICMVHQRLDEGRPYGVKNAQKVRRVFERSEKVLAVFQGHNHINAYNHIGGVHYCTLHSVVDGPFPKENGYAIVDLFSDGSVRIDGFRKQSDYQWKAIA